MLSTPHREIRPQGIDGRSGVFQIVLIRIWGKEALSCTRHKNVSIRYALDHIEHRDHSSSVTKNSCDNANSYLFAAMQEIGKLPDAEVILWQMNWIFTRFYEASRTVRRFTFWSLDEVTSCTKSATPFLGGHWKPSWLKKGTMYSLGPWNTMCPELAVSVIWKNEMKILSCLWRAEENLAIKALLLHHTVWYEH